MVGIPDPDKDKPLNELDDDEVITGGSEEEIERRRIEQDAMKAAKRANERIKRDEGGNEFTNIGPI